MFAFFKKRLFRRMIGHVDVIKLAVYSKLWPELEKQHDQEKAKQLSLKIVPGDVTGVAIEKKLGKQAIVVEVLTKDGSEIDVIIDMETGAVLGTEE